ncbi:MAG TPA: outer membrane beta-barrel family protein, partial [Niastella sp.]
MLTSRLYTLLAAAFFICSTTNAQQRDTSGTLKPAIDSARSKQLKTVVVTGQKTRYIEQQIDKIVVNPNALISSTGGNVVDALNNAPGVSVDENGGVSLTGRENVIIYINDRPAHLAGTDLLNYLKSLPVSMIEQIELMSNPSSRYNADGAAIINIKIKKLKTRGFNGNTSLGAGFSRYFKSNNSLVLNYRNNNINVFFNGGFTVNNVYFHSHRQRVYSYPNNSLSYTLLQNVRETGHQLSGNYNLGIDYTLSKNTTVGILYNGYAGPYRESGNYSNQFTGNTNKPDSSIISNSRYSYKTNRNAVNMNLQHFMDNHRREININLDYLQYANHPNQRLASNLYWPNDSLVKQYALITESPYTALIYSANANYSDTLFRKVKYEQGIQNIYSIRTNTSNYFNETGNEPAPDPALTNKFRYRENIQAAYINLSTNFSRLSLQAGMRVERTTGNALLYAMASKPDTSFTRHYTNLFPTAFLLYKLDSSGKHTLAFSAGKRIERPDYNDLNPASFYFDKNTASAGNSLLQPAFSTNFELSYTYNRKFTAGINYSNTKGLITRGYKQVNGTFISLPVNVDHYTTWGTSISWSFNIARWWMVNIDQQFVNRHYKGAVFNDGLYIDENLTTLYLKTYHQFKFDHGWSADLTTTYRSKLLLWQSSQEGRPQVHAGIQKKLNEKATLTLSGTDLFHTATINRDINIPYAQVNYYLVFDTQQVRFTFSYRFGKAFNR